MCELQRANVSCSSQRVFAELLALLCCSEQIPLDLSASMSASSSTSASSAGTKRMVEQLGGQDSKPKKRTLVKRDTEQQVSRIIKTHFSGWSETATDYKKVRGNTLRGHLLDAKRGAKDKDKRISAGYINQLKDEFKEVEGDITLTVQNMGDTVDPDLFSALASAQSVNPQKRSRAQLFHWLRSGKECNQRECVGIIRSISNITVSTSPQAKEHVWEVLNYFADTNQMDTYMQELRTVKSIFDACLVATYTTMRGQNLQVEDFWASCGHLVAVLGDITDWQRVMAATGGWKKVSSELERVVASSNLGSLLFSEASKLLALEQFSEQCQTNVNTMVAEGVSDATMKVCKETRFSAWMG